MAQITYSPRKFANATGKVAALSHAVDVARNNGTAELLAWGQQAIMGLREGKLTIEAIQQAIIAACHPITDNAPKLADMTIGHCGSTIKGRFYALKRIAADKASGDKLLAGEAFNVVAKAAPQIQKQTTGKRNKGAAKGGKTGKASAGITLEQALSAVNGWLDSGLKDRELAESIANNAELAAMFAKVAAIQAMLAKPARKGKTIQAIGKSKTAGKVQVTRQKAA